jgi:hypothetical protein
MYERVDVEQQTRKAALTMLDARANSTVGCTVGAAVGINVVAVVVAVVVSVVVAVVVTRRQPAPVPKSP